MVDSGLRPDPLAQLVMDKGLLRSSEMKKGNDDSVRRFVNVVYRLKQQICIHAAHSTPCKQLNFLMCGQEKSV
ncbi:hypothetical protein FCM35_KLT10201 [Carex littledalei]|uniref:Uncharacterized protein n=1 Tax=Carex littledalei TaxID=544730 RepID=A0A833RID6_9POAL|nr:hypothetical protein FCM35_KLT10201 [Carex littledalei]